MNDTLKILVAYHSPCKDGYFAAVEVAKQFRKTKVYFEGYSGHQLTTFPIAHHDVLNNLCPVKFDDYNVVIFVDYMPTVSQYCSLYQNYDMTNTDVFVFDHHKTAKEFVLEKDGDVAFGYLIADNHSGATLCHVIDIPLIIAMAIKYKGTAKYVDYVDSKMTSDKTGTWHTNIVLGTTVGTGSLIDKSWQPKTIQEIENPIYRLVGVRDLWLTDDPKLKEQADWFFSGLALCPQVNILRPEEFERLLQFDADNSLANQYVDDTTLKGSIIHSANVKSASLMLDRAKFYVNEKTAFFIDFVPSNLVSLWGNMACARLKDEGHETVFAIALAMRDVNLWNIGLRSDGSFDVSALAKALNENGGGHHAASGCTVYCPLEELISKIQKFAADESAVWIKDSWK